jgi:glycosyltransferase involved in cell wall biosynthesis
MNARRIMIVSPWPSPADGIATHSQQLAMALTATGDAEVTVLCRNTGSAIAGLPGVHVVPALDSPTAARQTVRRFAPDILYVQFAIPAFGAAVRGVLAACKEAQASGARVVVVFHEAIREYERLGRACAPLYRSLLARCDVPVVLTPAAVDVLVRFGAKRSSIMELPHGIRALPAGDVTPPWPIAGDPRPVVLCLGFIHPDKGIDTAIAAVQRLVKGDDPLPVRLVIAGSVRRRRGLFRLFGAVDIRHEADLVGQVRAFGLSGSVEFVGFLPEPSMVAALSSATAVLVPYRSTTQSGIAALTSAAGTPVVASDLPGLRSALGDGAVYVTPGNPLALAAAIRTVLGDDQLRAAMVTSQLRRRTAESMDCVARQILSSVQPSVGAHVR